MPEEPRDLRIGDWRLKVREPEGEGPHPAIFLVHGWTGDERSMWIFASRLPKNALLVAPRAPYVSTHEDYGGYSWVQHKAASFSRFEAFGPAEAAFEQLLQELPQHLDGDFSQFDLMGFSQGAAFCYSYALQNPEKVGRLAGLAGFLPEGGEQLAESLPLQGKSVFVAHGSQDEVVPVARAREARKILALAGAEVRYCEDEVGHKLGADCFRALRDFFT